MSILPFLCMYITGAFSATLWIPACDAAAGTMNISEAGTYTVWAWASNSKATEITLDGMIFPVVPTEEKTSWSWYKLEPKELTQGEHTLTLGEGVAVVVLSTSPDFDAAKAWGFRSVFTEPSSLDDRRLIQRRHTDTVYTMPHFYSREEWEQHADKIRRRILLACGLFPPSEKSPLNPVVFDTIEHEGYTVQKVYFEAYPGFYVTGNLYKPIGAGPFPGVLNPHGHWDTGRFGESESGSVRARCITFAKMGMVAFSYDMLGYNDSKQLIHRWSSPRTKIWGIHPFALQLWSSIRALDFLETLPEVDPSRIACTGASGGGTQTFALTAVEPRVVVSAPVCMISSTMQGGCVCENAPLIRLENSNMEIGALAAPRPLILVSATGDWTRETPRVEFPAIRSIYALYNAEDRVENVHINAGHNYNRQSREAVYRFFGRHLLPDKNWETFTEPPYELDPVESLRVFPDDLPPGAATADQVLESLLALQRDKVQKILPKTVEDIGAFQERFHTVFTDLTNARVPAVNDLQPKRLSRSDYGAYVVERWVIRRPCVGDAIPALLYLPSTGEAGSARNDCVLLVHGQGKAAFTDPVTGEPGTLIRGLLERNKAVLAIDVFLTGDYHSVWAHAERKTVGTFLDTFEPTDTSLRIQDILTAAAFARSRRDLSGNVSLVGLEEAGIWAALAGAVDPGIRVVVADCNDYDVDSDELWAEKYYIPSLRTVGDLRAAVAMMMPRPVYLLRLGASATTPWYGAQVYADLPALETWIDAL